MTKGWKTSEFWLTALFNLSALLTIVAGVVPSQAAPLVVAAAGIVTALYNFGRSMVKAGAGAGATGVPQRRATDTVGTVSRAVAEALERAAVSGGLKSGLGRTAAGGALSENAQGREVFDERNAG